MFPGNSAEKNSTLKTVSKIVSKVERRSQKKWEKRRASMLKCMQGRGGSASSVFS